VECDVRRTLDGHLVVIHDATIDRTTDGRGRVADLKHIANAHTDGDTYVWFKTANVLSTGDTFTNGRYPNIDFANGGNVRGMIAATDALLRLANARTKIVPGHGPLADRAALIKTLSVLPEYLRNKATESGAVFDYRDWHIPLGRRFRALKLWFVIRHYGVNGLRYHVKRHIELAQRFASWVTADGNFELAAPVLELLAETTAFPARHRDSRDESGKLTFVAGADRYDLIRELPVVDVATGQTLLLGDMERPYSQDWLNGMS